MPRDSRRLDGICFNIVDVLLYVCLPLRPEREPMNTSQYTSKERALFKGIVNMVNARLRNWPHVNREATWKDTERNEDYTIVAWQNRDWTLMAHDNIDRVVLRVSYGNARIRIASGIRYGGIGRIIHVDTVPNDHTFKMIAQLLASLK